MSKDEIKCYVETYCDNPPFISNGINKEKIISTNFCRTSTLNKMKLKSNKYDQFELKQKKIMEALFTEEELKKCFDSYRGSECNTKNICDEISGGGYCDYLIIKNDIYWKTEYENDEIIEYENEKGGSKRQIKKKIKKNKKTKKRKTKKRYSRKTKKRKSRRTKRKTKKRYSRKR